jgi:hypothetical protein
MCRGTPGVELYTEVNNFFGTVQPVSHFHESQNSYAVRLGRKRLIEVLNN